MRYKVMYNSLSATSPTSLENWLNDMLDEGFELISMSDGYFIFEARIHHNPCPVGVETYIVRFKRSGRRWEPTGVPEKYPVYMMTGTFARNGSTLEIYVNAANKEDASLGAESLVVLHEEHPGRRETSSRSE